MLRTGITSTFRQAIAAPARSENASGYTDARRAFACIAHKSLTILSECRLAVYETIARMRKL
jgi:hypothetical protein